MLTWNVLRATTACTFSTSQLQKWSEHGVLCIFWLRNVLHATTACTFSTSQLPKVVRAWCVLHILTRKCASRHNSVQFFISRLARWLAPAALASLLFDPRKPQIIEKHSVLRLSYLSLLFAHLHLLSSDSFSSLIFSLLIFLFSLPLPCSAFHLSILSEVWLLNFLRWYTLIHFDSHYIYHFQTPCFLLPTTYRETKWKSWETKRLIFYHEKMGKQTIWDAMQLDKTMRNRWSSVCSWLEAILMLISISVFFQGDPYIQFFAMEHGVRPQQKIVKFREIKHW